MARERLLGILTRPPSKDEGPYSVRNQRPDLDCLHVIEDYEARNPLQRWLLNWSPDSDCYASSVITVTPERDAWACTFRSASDGTLKTVRVPRKGTPPPPGRD